MPPTPPDPPPAAEGLVTNELLMLAKAGDPVAIERIMSRYLPRLQRWASGRLPSYARSLLDTSDLVQDDPQLLRGDGRVARK